MKIAVVTDIPLLCDKTQYLDLLSKGTGQLDVKVDKFLVAASRTKLEGKFPFQRLIGASLLLRTLIHYDLLHVQFSFPLGFWYALSKRIHGTPLLIHTHGVDVFSVPSVNYGIRRNLIGRLVTQKAWSSASHIITVCTKARNELVAAGTSPQKISVLPNGVDVAFFKRQAIHDAQLNEIRNASSLVFLNVASTSPVKNHRTLLRAFRHFVKTYNKEENAKLLICGGGSLTTILKALTRALKIQDEVVFLGHQPHHKMPEIYSTADAFILPSLSEAHPWSLLEAMSCSLPAIASAVGGIPETLPDRRLLFNPHAKTSVTDLYDRMVFLAEAEKRRRKLGALNRETAIKRFTIGHHINRLCQIYAEAIDESGNEC